MNGEMPKYLVNEVLPQGYYDAPNPYKPMPEAEVNLLELSRYAKGVGKKIIDLTKEEVEKYRNSALK